MELERDVRISVLLPANEWHALDAARAFGLVQHGSHESSLEDAGPALAPLSLASSLARETAVRAGFDREFAFPGEQATLFVAIEPRGEPGCAVHDLERQDLVDLCLSLELLLNASDESCKVSSVLPCPRQPGWAREEPASQLSKNEQLVAAFARACAVFYFQIEMPLSSVGASGETLQSIDLTLYCRLKSASATALVAKVATGINLRNLREIDATGLPQALPEAQEILCNEEPSQAINSQTLKVHKSVRRVSCLAVRSRHKQVDSRCFIEVSCENTHDAVTLVLKDLTLHTFTSRPITMRVARVGRWALPVALAPGERQTVCFCLSGFEAASLAEVADAEPQGEGAAADAGSDLGTRYTSVATVTWGSDVTLRDVRGQHRVEWGFCSGAFDRLALRLVRDEEANAAYGSAAEILGDRSVRLLRCGERLRVELELVNRVETDMDLFILAPAPDDLGVAPVIAVDALIRVGRLAGLARTMVPVFFLAVRPGRVNLAGLIYVYDAASGRSVPVKEPHHISVFPESE